MTTFADYKKNILDILDQEIHEAKPRIFRVVVLLADGKPRLRKQICVFTGPNLTYAYQPLSDPYYEPPGVDIGAL